VNYIIEIDVLLGIAKEMIVDPNEDPNSIVSELMRDNAQQRFTELFFRTCYKIDSSPVHLWSLYAIHRKNNWKPIHEVILKYFDSVAVGFRHKNNEFDERRLVKENVLKFKTVKDAYRTNNKLRAALLSYIEKSDDERLQNIAEKLGVDLRTINRWEKGVVDSLWSH